jgi:hypothetical protein
MSYLFVETVQMGSDGAIGSASNVMTMSESQKVSDDLREINKKFSTMATGKYPPSKLCIC